MLRVLAEAHLLRLNKSRNLATVDCLKTTWQVSSLNVRKPKLPRAVALVFLETA